MVKILKDALYVSSTYPFTRIDGRTHSHIFTFILPHTPCPIHIRTTAEHHVFMCNVSIETNANVRREEEEEEKRRKQTSWRKTTKRSCSHSVFVLVWGMNGNGWAPKWWWPRHCRISIFPHGTLFRTSHIPKTCSAPHTMQMNPNSITTKQTQIA